jgi:hypothetical protein
MLPPSGGIETKYERNTNQRLCQDVSSIANTDLNDYVVSTWNTVHDARTLYDSN